MVKKGDKEKLDEEDVEEIAKKCQFCCPINSSLKKNAIGTIKGFVVAKDTLLYDMFQTFKNLLLKIPTRQKANKCI